MSDFIKVDLIHNLYKNKIWKEIKLNRYDKIENIKKKIYTHTGTAYDNMNLYACDEFSVEKTQVALNNDNFCLNDYNVKDNYTIYVYETGRSFYSDIYNIDDNENLEKLKHLKYQIKEEDYDKRKDNFRTFLRKLKEKKKEDIKLNDNEKIINNNYDQDLYKIGNRCRIKMGDRRGVLKFVGNIKNNNEFYVGIDLDEPLGNSNGFFNKEILFDCKGDKYGYIGNINSIEMGDFPPLDIMNLEEF